MFLGRSTVPSSSKIVSRSSACAHILPPSPLTLVAAHLQQIRSNSTSKNIRSSLLHHTSWQHHEETRVQHGRPSFCTFSTARSAESTRTDEALLQSFHEATIGATTTPTGISIPRMTTNSPLQHAKYSNDFSLTEALRLVRVVQGLDLIPDGGSPFASLTSSALVDLVVECLGKAVAIIATKAEMQAHYQELAPKVFEAIMWLSEALESSSSSSLPSENVKVVISNAITKVAQHWPLVALADVAYRLSRPAAIRSFSPKAVATIIKAASKCLSFFPLTNTAASSSSSSSSPPSPDTSLSTTLPTLDDMHRLIVGVVTSSRYNFNENGHHQSNNQSLHQFLVLCADLIVQHELLLYPAPASLEVLEAIASSYTSINITHDALVGALVTVGGLQVQQLLQAIHEFQETKKNRNHSQQQQQTDGNVFPSSFPSPSSPSSMTGTTTSPPNVSTMLREVRRVFMLGYAFSLQGLGRKKPPVSSSSDNNIVNTKMMMNQETRIFFEGYAALWKAAIANRLVPISALQQVVFTNSIYLYSSTSARYMASKTKPVDNEAAAHTSSSSNGNTKNTISVALSLNDLFQSFSIKMKNSDGDDGNNTSASGSSSASASSSSSSTSSDDSDDSSVQLNGASKLSTNSKGKMVPPPLVPPSSPLTLRPLQNAQMMQVRVRDRKLGFAALVPWNILPPVRISGLNRTAGGELISSSGSRSSSGSNSQSTSNQLRPRNNSSHPGGNNHFVLPYHRKKQIVSRALIAMHSAIEKLNEEFTSERVPSTASNKHFTAQIQNGTETQLDSSSSIVVDAIPLPNRRKKRVIFKDYVTSEGLSLHVAWPERKIGIRFISPLVLFSPSLSTTTTTTTSVLPVPSSYSISLEIEAERSLSQSLGWNVHFITTTNKGPFYSGDAYVWRNFLRRTLFDLGEIADDEEEDLDTTTIKKKKSGEGSLGEGEWARKLASIFGSARTEQGNTIVF